MFYGAASYLSKCSTSSMNLLEFSNKKMNESLCTNGISDSHRISDTAQILDLLGWYSMPGLEPHTDVSVY